MPGFLWSAKAPCVTSAYGKAVKVGRVMASLGDSSCGRSVPARLGPYGKMRQSELRSVGVWQPVFGLAWQMGSDVAWLRGARHGGLMVRQGCFGVLRFWLGESQYGGFGHVVMG